MDHLSSTATSKPKGGEGLFKEQQKFPNLEKNLNIQDIGRAKITNQIQFK
jgi:hypothetical protein